MIISDIAAWCCIEFGDNPLYDAHHLYSDEKTEIRGQLQCEKFTISLLTFTTVCPGGEADRIHAFRGETKEGSK